jgi:CheY-like chemotaxis protein/HPt (histidine-containing phosphotransfer) domain-containing protein
MSHEIRTPMNAIIGLSQIMEKGLLDDRQAGYLSRIRNSADILLSLINDILDFSKIDAGHMELEQIIFDINEVVEKAVDVQSISAANKSIAFIVDLAPDLPHKLIGDPVRLNQVLMNLLSNAIKFTEKGKIVLSIQLNSTEGNHIRLQIMLKDTGIGIAEKDQIHLFNAFKQADGSTTRRFGGTGLGLAISQKIVRLMDGEISLISQEGQGSEFYFTANFLVPEDAQTLGEMLAGKMRFLTNSEEKRFNCILVGNGPSVEFIHKSLSQYEVNTTYFADTKQAIRQLSLLKAVSKQVLLWDLSSSNLSIHELMGMLSDLPSMNSIVLVIMVSVKELERDEVHLQRLPHAVVLTKPILITRLINTIVKAMNKPDSKDVLVTPFKEVHESTLLNKELNPDDGSVVDFKQASVLVVEDNHVNQMVARELLEPYGVKVSIVENGQQALNLLQTSPDVFRLILMDIHMPVMDGYEATKAIRKLQIMTPIIALTANATTDERTRCLEVGMNDFLSKPIDQVKLLSALKKWVQYQSGTNLHEDKVAEKNTNGQHQNAEESKEEIYIDILAMQRRFKNNEQIIPRVLKAFEESFDHFEEEFNEAYHHKNNELMYRMAHSLKGSAANISANTLSELAANLEKRVHDGTQKGLLEYAHVVAEKLQKVLIAGRSYTVNKNT